MSSVDVFPDWEVRSTTYPSGHLLVQRDEAEGPKRVMRFALMVGEFGSYRCAGSIFGYECARDEWWRSPSKEDDRPCYCVPQDALTFDDIDDALQRKDAEYDLRRSLALRAQKQLQNDGKQLDQ